MNAVRYEALFTIVDEDGQRIITSDGGTFDTHTYSRFKYSDPNAAAYYGTLLAEGIQRCHIFQKANTNPDDVVITASAYKSLPTAAQAVATAAIETLKASGCPVHKGRIHRDKLTEGDYGAMSADERAYWMSCNGLWVDPEIFEGRHVIVADDVSISGAHGRAIVSMFASVPLASLTLMHIIELDPALAIKDPKIEDRMNHAVIKNLGDLRHLINQHPEYTPNARTVKFVLSHPIDQLTAFLRSLPDSLVCQLHYGVQADEYDRMQSYMLAAQHIATVAAERIPERQLRLTSA